SVAENSYQVNGLNITNFRNGLGSNQVPMEFIEEIQVKTGGYAAEYGRSTGGVINMVTKSGSNSLHGSFSLFFEPESLQEQEPDTYLRPNQSEERELLEANASLGGAVFKDKLFFFGFVRYTDSNSLFITGNTEDVSPDEAPGRGTREEIGNPYWGGKIDWNITSNHRVEATYITDDVEVDVTTYDFDLYERSLGDATGVGVDKRGGENYIFKYTGIFTENFLLAAQYGSNEFNRTSQSSNDSSPYAYDSRGGGLTPLGDWVNALFSTAFDEREAYRVDADWYLGSHSLRFGLDSEENFSFDDSQYSGGVYYRYFDDDDSPTGVSARVRHYVNGGGFDVTSEAAYAQDSWSVTPNLTVNLGVRYEEFENLTATGEPFISITDQWSPRLGLIWDPSGEGRSKVFASYGEYYLPIASNTNIRLSGAESFDEAYYVWENDALNPDGSPVGFVDCGFGNLGTCGNQGSVGDLLQYNIYGSGEVPDPRETVSTNIKPMSQNEIIIGYERMVGDDWSFGVRGVMREFNEVIEDYTIDAGLFERYGLCDPDDGGCFAYRLGNPGSDFIGFYDIDGDGELDEVEFSAEELAYPKAERDYYALEFTFKRRFADNWMFQGSYTWSHLYGNYEGYVRSDNGQDDAGLTTLFDFPGLLENADGNLPQDRRHNLKTFGAYAWDSGLQVGGSFYYTSGRPVSAFGVHPGHDGGFAALYGAESFFDQGEAVPRGSRGSTDDLFGLDGMIKYDFQMGNVDMNVRLDIFNMFDNDASTEVNELADQETGAVNPNYTKVTHYQQPRRVRIGFGLTF
ncbi:MAG: TonB-dependent receptor, partial [Acidobacteria bacterium]|nr:TonB-dependent receptor [Acidobacteriota bacterium]